MVCDYIRTIYESKSHYVVACYETKDELPENCSGDSTFTAVGYYLPQDTNLQYDLQGKWVNNAQYGVQYSVSSAKSLVPSTKEGIIAYLSSGLIKGIGSKTAKLIVDRFGQDTLDILTNTPERLTEIRGISARKLDNIKSGLASTLVVRELAELLAPHGFSQKLIMKIYKTFGENSIEIIKHSPFELCNKIRGMGFKRVDQIARAAAIDLTDQSRIMHGIIFVLTRAQAEGHLYLTVDELVSRSKDILSTDTVSITNKDIGKALNLGISLGMLVSENRQRIFLAELHQAETTICNELARLMRGKSPFRVSPQKLSETVKEVETELGIVLSPQQVTAVITALINPVSIITGGAGTGKTTVLNVILAVARKLKRGCCDFCLLAPTGRAARRMCEATGNPASTIHSCLKLRFSDDEDETEKVSVIISSDLCVIDEFSMVDAVISGKLFAAIETNTPLIMVGDYEQLPSVGAGSVFRELIESDEIPTTRLQVIFRQSSISNIVLNSDKILKNDHKLVFGGDFRFIKVPDANVAANYIRSVYMSKVAQYGIDDVAVLTPQRERSVVGSASLNAVLREIYLNGHSDSSIPFQVKDKVMNIRNTNKPDPNGGTVDICNGDIGYVISVDVDEENDCTLTVDYGDRQAIYYRSKDDFSLLQYAYATTIHKSQGSEYKCIIVPIVTANYLMLRRNLLYTAVTRGKTEVILVGQPSALHMAIERTDDSQRNTVLGKRLKYVLSRGS